MSDDLKAEYAEILSIKDTDLLSNFDRDQKRKLMSIRGPYFKVFLPNPEISDTPFFEDRILEVEYLM